MSANAAEVSGNRCLVEERAELVQEVASLLVQSAAVFDLARSFSPQSVRQLHVISRMRSPFVQTSVGPHGEKIMSRPSLPEQPEGYELPAIVLPAAEYQDVTNGRLVRRRVASTMELRYDYEKQSGVAEGLPLPSPTPDHVRFSNRAILMDGEIERRKNNQLTPVLGFSVLVTNGDELVSSEFAPTESFPYQDYPASDNNWEVFSTYPEEALTASAVDLHRQVARVFAARLALIEMALLNSRWSPDAAN